MPNLPSKAPSAESEPPTPPPSSAVVPIDGTLLFGVDSAAVSSLAELPPELRDNPYVAQVLAMTAEEEVHLAARFAAIDAARKAYGDETSDAWLRALRDGTHPLCRVPEPTRR